MVFALILILTADNELAAFGGQPTESMEACADLVQRQTQIFLDGHPVEGLHLDARCLNLAPLPTDDNIFQPKPAESHLMPMRFSSPARGDVCGEGRTQHARHTAKRRR